RGGDLERERQLAGRRVRSDSECEVDLADLTLVPPRILCSALSIARRDRQEAQLAGHARAAPAGLGQALGLLPPCLAAARLAEAARRQHAELPPHAVLDRRR